MKRIVKGLVITTAVMGSGVAAAEAFEGFSPYAGVDYKQMWLNPKDQTESKDFGTYRADWTTRIGSSIIIPGADIYAGAKFHENFGAELGWGFSRRTEADVTKTRRVVNAAGVELSNRSTNDKSKISLHGPRFDLMAYYPVAERVELIGSLGAGWTKGRLTVSHTESAYPEANEKTTLKGKWSFVPRVGMGVKCDITDTFGVRAMARWEATSQVRLKGEDENGLEKTYKPFKSNVSMNVGVYAKF